MTKKYFYYILFYFVAGFMSAFLSLQPVSAEEVGNKDSGSQGITISPPLREFAAKKGETYHETIKLSNPSQNIVELYPLSMNFSAEGETGQPKFSASESNGQNYALSDWISFTQPKIAVAPQQIVDFKYDINIPNDAEAGGHYGVVFFSTQPPQASGSSSQVSISSMVGSLILITIDGDISEKLVLNTFEFPRIIMSGDLNIKTRLSNRGNVHLKPTGEISIKSMISSLSNAVAFNPERGNILPNTVRSFNNVWMYNIFKDIGPHQIELKLTYGEENQIITAQDTVWILPWWLISVLALIMVIIIAVIIKKSRKKSRGFSKFFRVP